MEVSGAHMEVDAIATDLAASSVSAGINVAVLRAVQDLAANQAAVLAASIGLGSGVDAYA
jgi:hypothetical protein